MARVYVESILPCDTDLAWAEVQRSELLLEVARPLVVIRPLRGEVLPERWAEGETRRCRLYLFGLLPLGTRTLFFERVDSERREIQTREHDRLVRRWDHLIRVQPLEGGRCRYADEIEIEAGLLTPLVGLFARWFYRHRQRRWQAVAKRLQGGGEQGKL